MVRRSAWMWCVFALLACGRSETKSKDSRPGGASPSGSAASTAGTESPEKRAHDEAAKAAGNPRAGQELPMESGKIVFEVTGIEAGTETAWFAGHGATVVVLRELTKPMVQKQVTVWRDGKNATWDLESKQKMVHITRLRSKATELAAHPTKQLEMGGYERKADETIAGVSAEIWHHPKVGTTLGIYKGVEIKSAVKLGKTESLTQAVSFQEGAELPTDLMTYPADYTVKDLTR